jgi:Hemerythrin HHE cation binding domain
MNPVASNEPKATTLSTANGSLSLQARSLRQRLDEIRALTDEMPSLSDAQLLEAMRHVRFLVDHIALHGHAEEHVVYPYIETFMSGSDAEIAGLRADHICLDNLGRAIIEWTPAQNRAALHDSLTEFLEIGNAHFLVEGEDCMPVVHAHILTGTEQVLFEAVEIETFDCVVADASSWHGSPLLRPTATMLLWTPLNSDTPCVSVPDEELTPAQPRSQLVGIEKTAQ